MHGGVDVKALDCDFYAFSGHKLYAPTGIFCWYSYISPLMNRIAGFAPSEITMLMVLAGGSMCVGNLLGGKLADRSALAGSVATMDRLIRTMVQKAEIPLADVIRMVSETPARIMGVLDRKGTLERGKDADIIALDRDLNVRAVWAMGQLVEGTNKLF